MKLLTLNVEGNKHWERIIPLLEKEQPDVLCLQELFDRDGEMLVQQFHYNTLFVPMTLDPYDAQELDWVPQGIGIFSKLPLVRAGYEDYHRLDGELKKYDRDNRQNTCRQALAFATFVENGQSFVVATTHLSVTPDGLPDEAQRRDFSALLGSLKKLPPHIVCGDFNMPRGYNDLYKQMIERYTDQIPLENESSLDTQLHRARKDPVEGQRIAKYMVDYIFTMPPYGATDVRLQFGVSDHAAVIAQITKSP